MTAPDSDLRAVPRIPAPDLSACGLFERGHHAHPVQVSLALKNVGDDGRFRAVELTRAWADDIDGRAVVRVRLRPRPGANTGDGSVAGEQVAELDLVGHDPHLAAALDRVEHPVFVWEEQYGVLFVMTEQGRDALGTGAVTLAAATALGPCRTDP
jgi:hypothetical protein